MTGQDEYEGFSLVAAWLKTRPSHVGASATTDLAAGAAPSGGPRKSLHPAPPAPIKTPPDPWFSTITTIT